MGARFVCLCFQYIIPINKLFDLGQRYYTHPETPTLSLEPIELCNPHAASASDKAVFLSKR